jgi:hypothetical protein
MPKRRRESVRVAMLIDERTRLLARLEEINQLLLAYQVAVGLNGRKKPIP